MESLLQLKKEIYEYCAQYLQNSIETLENVLKNLEESRNNESKSSVGDKYETGRAMMQLEEDKIKTQLHELLSAKAILQSIKPDKVNNTVETDSLVITDSGIYYIAIAVGKIKINQQLIYGISIESPIGQSLKSKKTGDQIHFNNRIITIQSVS